MRLSTRLQKCLCIGLLGPCGGWSAPVANLCTNSEETVFSCGFRTKIASVCALSREDGRLLYVQYRFGGPRVEISIPPQEPFDLGRIKGQAFSGAHGGAEEVVFTNGEFAYRVQTSWDMRDARYDAAEIQVERGGQVISRFECKPLVPLLGGDHALRRLIPASGMKALQ